jgi:hypothetical protein
MRIGLIHFRAKMIWHLRKGDRSKIAENRQPHAPMDEKKAPRRELCGVDATESTQTDYVVSGL